MSRNKKQGTPKKNRSAEPVSPSSRYSREIRRGSRYEDLQPDKGEPDYSAMTFWQRLMIRDPLALAEVLLVSAVIIAYIVITVFFRTHFYPWTSVWGSDISRLTAGQVREMAGYKGKAYSLILSGREEAEESITADQISFYYDDADGIEQTLQSQHSWLWPVMMFVRRGTSIDMHTGWDDTQLEEAVDGLDMMQTWNMKAPVDAHLDVDETRFIVAEESEGTTLVRSRVLDAARQALSAGSTVVSLDQEGCYEQPAVRSDDEELNAEAAARNEVMGANLTYDFGDRTEQVNASVIQDFLVLKTDGTYDIDPDQVRAYVAQLAETYDTYEGHRTFYTTLDTTVELYGGDYGWQIDQSSTSQALIQALRDKEQGTITPVYVHTAMSRNADDIGGTYVEISISEQTMWCYQNGVLAVETPVVTGNPNKDNATPTGGVWAIDGKFRDYTLVGQGYRTPVSYWMPFNGNVGIHDMQSRYYFGSTIYLYAGSHGCINTPLEAVAQIYDIVSVGTPVIVYD